MNWKRLSLSGWGNTSRINTTACRPETQKDLINAIKNKTNKNLICYGMGRSYGDVALNNNQNTILTTRLNQIISFNKNTGEIVTQAGVSFDDLMQTFLPKGFMPPVTPGTSYVTIGGAIANDVHGKNHDKDKSFGNFIKWIELALPNGEIIKASPKHKKDIFFATIGGVGLTGIILKACFNMIKIPSSYVNVKKTRIKDLGEYLSTLDDIRDKSKYSVGWIDCLAKGKNMGRGILETADISQKPPQKKQINTPKINIPLNFPNFALNPITINAFNNIYYRHIPKSGSEFTQHMRDFFYPLDAILNWNKIYGKKGFYQFQFVIPDENGHEGIKKLLEEISKAKKGSFLAVIKTLGSQGLGHLSFPMKGYTLALDFPNKGNIKELLKKLEKITLDYNGRLYLGKDALMSASSLEKMYPKLNEFRSICQKIDPNNLMSSDQAKRLKIKRSK